MDVAGIEHQPLPGFHGKRRGKELLSWAVGG
jgi:hypothetical protein